MNIYFRLFACVSLVLCVMIVHADERGAPATAPATQPAIDPGKPTDLVKKQGARAEQFEKLHQSFLKRIEEGPIDLLFLGDSITAGWNSRAKGIFNKYYGDHHPANFGIGGDQTQNLLWRINNGELENIKPKVVVLMIGTNNTAKDSADAVAAGVTKIVNTVREKCPESKILLLGVFPRTKGPETQLAKIPQINAIIAKLDDGKMIRFLDIGEKFYESPLKISAEVMNDGLHPTEKGYQIWADAMQPLLDGMLK